MDPISITTGVLTLLSHSISAIQSCQTFAAKYQMADLSIRSVRTECASIRIALLQIHTLISRVPAQETQDQFQQHLLDEYKAVLDACSFTFTLLNDRLGRLGLYKLHDGNENEMRAKLRLRFIWKEPQMDRIRQDIKGQVMAVSLLLTAFQSETTTRSYEILTSQQTKNVLASVSNAAESLREASLMEKAEMTVVHTSDSIIGDEEFLFDDAVINSQVYRRAFFAQQKKVKVGPIQEEEVDIETSIMPNPSERRDEIQSPERPKSLRKSSFLRRIFEKTSRETDINATKIKNSEGAPSTIISSTSQSDSSSAYLKENSYGALPKSSLVAQKFSQNVSKLMDSYNFMPNSGKKPNKQYVIDTTDTIAHRGSTPLCTRNGERSILDFNGSSTKEQEHSTLEQVQRLKHESTVQSVIFSPSGLLASSSFNGASVLIWEADQQGKLQQIQDLKHNDDDWVVAFDFSSDGWQLACCEGYSGKVIIWEADRHGLLQNLQQLQHNGRVTSCVFSPDGQMLAVGAAWDGFGKVVIWKADRRGRLQEVQQKEKGKPNSVVNSVAFSPDGRWVAAGVAEWRERYRYYTHGNVVIWEVDREGMLQQIQQFKHDHVVLSVAFSPDGQRLASGGDGIIMLWEMDQQRNLQEVQQIEGDKDNFLQSLAFSHNGRWLASVWNCQKVAIWEIDKEGRLRQVQQLEHDGRVGSLAFSPDGCLLASGSDFDVIIWQWKS